jgi:hypothetical protein
VRFDPGALLPLPAPGRSSVRSIPGDENWIPRFGPAGADAPVRAILEHDGDLVIGGDFTQVRGVEAAFVARIRDFEGLPLGAGVNGRVLALASHEGDVIAGGEFSEAGGAPASRVARWDGVAWTALGDGLPGDVHALHSHAGQLWAGGEFPGHVAVWDGTSWSIPDAGTDDWVRAFATHEGLLYAAGDFTQAGSQAAFRVARWTGSGWEPAGLPGFDAPVFALLSHEGYLWAGGLFSEADLQPARRVARWDGFGWSPAGSGFDDFVWDLTGIDGGVVAAGAFRRDGSLSRDLLRVARWGTFGWEPMGAGFDATVWALASPAERVEAGGSFVASGSNQILRLAEWDGQFWLGEGAGADGPVRGFARLQDHLWMFGKFDLAGGTASPRLVEWNGSAWRPGPGTIPLARVDAITEQDGDLLIAGKPGPFVSSGNCSRRWSGSAWLSVGGPLVSIPGQDVVARDIIVYQGEVWICGRFRQPSPGIARLGPGNMWEPAPGGEFDIATDESIWKMMEWNGLLLVAGDFRENDGVPLGRIAAWNGTEWLPLGEGFDDRVRALTVHDGDLHAGGLFERAEGLPARGVARWDGTRWLPVGQGLGGRVRALASSGGVLYAAGASLRLPDGSDAHDIARFGATGGWTGLGSGLGEGGVFGLLTEGTEVWVGGKFQEAGGKVAQRIALWSEPAGSSLARALPGGPGTKPAIAPVVFPNPSAGPVVFRFELARRASVALEMFDVAGRRVVTIDPAVRAEGRQSLRWDGRGPDGRALPAGVYFYRLDVDGERVTGKIVRTEGLR